MTSLLPPLAMRPSQRWLGLALGAVVLPGCSDGGPARAGTAPSLDAGTRDVADAAAPDRTKPVPPPALGSLEISPLVLTPSFSPAIHDYYVRCAQGVNSLSVSMLAAEGSTAGITAPAAAASSGRDHADVHVAENDAIVAVAVRGDETSSYWIRCLPHDFPELAMNAVGGAEAPTPGYYLVGNTLIAPSDGGYAMVLDVNGVPVWYHTTANGAGGANVDVPSHDVISYVGNLPYTFAEVNGAYEIHRLEDGSTDLVTPAGSPLDVHELRQLPNGHHLVFSRPIESGVDLTGLGSFGANEYMVNCVMSELDDAGVTVWQWTATDHFDPVKTCTYPQGEESAITSRGGREIVADPFHCNSIDVLPSGDLLVSARHTDSIFLISKATGKLLWKMGGTSDNKDGAPFIAVKNDPLRGFYRQHDARFLPDGTVSLFDDRTLEPGDSRAIILSFDVHAGSASIVWQYSATAGSQSMGSFRVLGDGSRIIGWGASGGRSPVFTELDANGKPALELVFPSGESSYRAIKVPLAELDIEWMRRSVGVPE